MPRIAPLVAIVLIGAACSSSGGVPVDPGAPSSSTEPASTDTGSATTGTPATTVAPATSAATTVTSTTLPPTTTTTTEPPGCSEPYADGPEPSAEPDTLDFADPVLASVAISEITFRCADTVVITTASDPEVALAAAELARENRAPLLFGLPGDDPFVATELERLAPDLVIRVGYEVTVPGTLDARIKTFDAADLELGELAGLLTDPGDPATALAGASAGFGASGVLWVVADTALPVAAAAAAASIPTGGLTVVVDGDDLRSPREAVAAVRDGVPPAIVGLLGEHTDEADWQLRALLDAEELPGGGLVLFPGRRMVALYGNPLTSVLGVLGEQEAEAAVTRAAEIAAPYDADGLELLLAFELIATVAAGEAGGDGNYSNEMDLDVLRPWIEVAADNGLYVLLDLQPGRSDFLTQARIYDEFLRMPHVGLALDPEWRLAPDEVHLQQFGTVDAPEVNQVVDYLAEIVREENLPQKMLLLHQFRLSMITNREMIEKTPELSFVIQMDGQGTLEQKYGTWDAITLALRDDPDWWWGWKNFYDEDFPTPTPDLVLDLDPTAVYVSYQ